ncbi:amino acid permease [Hymenobacter qilianensis]|uniref:Amino acid permease n=1 Tax=Hymenobacter qilianensis TaxID=1385715 RepID=A0ACB5PQA7_9BACT|nr:amino acid permease [Hymenobacter qilianensis]GGF61307.1 amino acid permease [Hymenobacter qilianensis]
MTKAAAPVYQIGLTTGVALVVANMVGTGVFTTLGFQLLDIQSGFVVLMLWVVGGLIALCGAWCYAELAAAMPRSGGEYQYLSQIYHPAVGFLSGWVSATVGFAAPTALGAMALSSYATSVWPALNPLWLSVAVVLVLTAIHASSSRAGSYLQVVITAAKVIVLVAFIGAGWLLADPQAIQFAPQPTDWGQLLSPEFAVSLIYVSYAYSGWNAVVYIAGEVKAPQRNLPRILLLGTSIVVFLYVALNFIFLYSTPVASLAGEVEVGYVAAHHLFGESVGRLMGSVIAGLLLSTVSSMIFAGPRIMQIMGEDMPALREMAVVSKVGIPVRAMLFQTALTLLFIFTSTFKAVLLYAGFVLSLFTFLTVMGLFVLRWRQPNLPRPYRAWGYPLTPLVFLTLSGWTLLFILRANPTESFYGLATLLGGLFVYYGGRRIRAKSV